MKQVYDVNTIYGDQTLSQHILELQTWAPSKSWTIFAWIVTWQMIMAIQATKIGESKFIVKNFYYC